MNLILASTAVNLPAVLIANVFGLLIIMVTLWGNHRKLSDKTYESKILLLLIIFVGVSCIIDVVTFYSDGKDGIIYTIINYVGNNYLFLTNGVVGPLWVALVCKHILGKVPKEQIIFCSIFAGICALLILINFIFPIVFSIETVDGINNVYVRQPMFYAFMVIEVVFIADGVFVYLYAKKTGGALKFFPVMQFIIPIIAGLSIQTCIYGVSTIWPAFAISVAGILTSLQNEQVYTDKLTELYNRYYLDHIKKKLLKKKSKSEFTIMMLDLNHFKDINDNYGHLVGDDALIQTANILRAVASKYGVIIRYAGDEFIVILNTTDQELAKKIGDKIITTMDKFNKIGRKQYDLSISFGFCKIDLRQSTIDEIMNKVDALMYEEKKRYHELHDCNKNEL